MRRNIKNHIISCLRDNSRIKLTVMAGKANIPLSTIHENVHKLLKTKLVKPTIMIDYNALGLPIKCWFSLSTRHADLISNIISSPHINTVMRTYHGADMLIEGVFSDLKQHHFFLERLKKIARVHSYPVINDIKLAGWNGFLHEDI